MGGIHDVLAVEDGIWVTSTAASLLVKLDWAGELVQHWNWAADSELARALGFRRPPRFDDTIDYRVPAYGLGAHDVVHMNAVISRASRLVVSLGQIRSPAIQHWQRVRSSAMRTGEALPLSRRAIAVLRNRRMRGGEERSVPAPGKTAASHAIVELDLRDGRPGAARALWRQGGVSTPKHNVGFAGETVVFNDSEIGLAGVRLATGDPEYTIPIPGSPTFARGLCMLGGDECLIGSQRPAAIYRVSLRTRSVLDAIELDGEPWETVYAICTVPDEFSRSGFAGFEEWAAGLDVAST